MISDLKRHGIMVSASIILLLLINWPVLSDLWMRWSAHDFTGPFAHGPFIVVFALWMTFHTLNSSSTYIRQSVNIYCFVLMAIIGIGLILANLVEINFLEHILLYASMLAIIWCIYSLELLKKMAYPLLLLVFILPVWDFINEPLRLITLHASNILLSLTTIPFYRDGYYLYLPNGVFEVARGCSGLQQYLVSMVLGVIYAYQHQLSLRSLVKLLLFLVCFAITINTIRVFVIILIGYFTEMRSTIVEEHVLLGWVIYGIGIIIFFSLYKHTITSNRITQTKELYDKTQSKQVYEKRVFWVNSLVIVAFIVLPSLLYHYFIFRINHREFESINYQFVDLGETKVSNQRLMEWHLNYPPAKDSIYKRLDIGGREVYLSVLIYRQKLENQEPINNLNTFYNKDTWHRYRAESILATDESSNKLQLKAEYIESKTGRKMVVLGWFMVNNKVTTDILMAKLYQLYGLLTLKQDIQVFALITDVETDDSALSVLKSTYDKIVNSSVNINN